MQKVSSDFVFLSIVIPAFNEEKKIHDDLTQIYDYFSKQDYIFEVIVVDDGSRDKTCELAKSFETRFQNLKCIHYAQNRGKGYALKEGILQAKGEFVLFADAGTCVPFQEVEKGLSLLLDGYDAAFGSRALAGSLVIRSQPLYRRLGAWMFGLVIRWFMGIDWIKDTQCGFKIFRLQAAKKIFKKNRINGFMFDVETIWNARKMGFRTVEFPVIWKNDPDTKFNPLTGSVRNLIELVKIKWQ